LFIYLLLGLFAAFTLAASPLRQSKVTAAKNGSQFSADGE